MAELAFLVSVPGLIALALGWALWTAHRRRRRMRLLQAHACAVCRTPFSEAIAEYLGPVSRGEKQAMDRFQRRFAVFKVHCLDCDSVNFCTADGTPFKGVLLTA